MDIYDFIPGLLAAIPAIIVAIHGYRTGARAIKKDEIDTMRTAFSDTIAQLTARLEKAEQRADRMMQQRDAERTARDAEVAALRDRITAMDNTHCLEVDKLKAQVKAVEKQSEEDQRVIEELQDRIGYLTRVISDTNEWLKEQNLNLPEHITKQRKTDVPLTPLRKG